MVCVLAIMQITAVGLALHEGPGGVSHMCIGLSGRAEDEIPIISAMGNFWRRNWGERIAARRWLLDFFGVAIIEFQVRCDASVIARLRTRQTQLIALMPKSQERASGYTWSQRVAGQPTRREGDLDQHFSTSKCGKQGGRARVGPIVPS